MSRDDDFTPRLGKIRSRSGKRGRRYLHQIVRAFTARRGSARGLFAPRRQFDGSRIGRGAGAGRVLRSRDRYGGRRARRVIIKTRIVRLVGKGTNAARLHLRYIQRDGVTREGRAGELYDARTDQADGRAFVDRGAGDRHQFRFIVAAEDGTEHPDLRDFTRRLMRQVETDLDTRLDWVAVDHYNTGHPHTHIVLRGKDERGKDLIIAREYIAHGMRERAIELMTLDLGPRSDLEIETNLRREVDQGRFTSLDRALLREAGDEGVIDIRGRPVGAPARFRRPLEAGRLQTLRRFGLALEEAPGLWRLSPRLEPTLRAMGERDDIIKTMHRAMSREGQAGGAEYAIYDPGDPRASRLVGRVVERGLADELNDRHYVVVDGIDGHAHYVDIGRPEAVDAVSEGTIVAVVPRRPEVRAADRVIADVAAANDGRYSADIHLRHDPTSSHRFVEAHVRRLEALRRAGVVTRTREGTWNIPQGFFDHVREYERQQVRLNPVLLDALSSLPLDRQAGADAATWLDRELVADSPEPVQDLGFGREVRAALTQRRQWLIERGLAEQRGDTTVYRRNLLMLLRRRELNRVGAQLARELGLPYAETADGQRVEGVYRRRLDLASGRFALIEKSREFTLVPWRPVLDRHVGKSVGGMLRGDEISWTIGRQRGPAIT